MDKQSKPFKLFETKNQILYGTVKGTRSAYVMWSVPHKKYAVGRFRSSKPDTILRELAFGKVTPIGLFKSRKEAKQKAKQSLI